MMTDEQVYNLVHAATESVMARVRELQGSMPPCDGSPEGVLTAPPGTIARDVTNGEAYIKNASDPTGNTGWKLITHA
jgi:hypothetical protein